MDAIEFVKKLNKKVVRDITIFTPNEYFETEEGQQMISIISRKVKVIDEKSFELTDWGTIVSFEINPLYQGRHFLADMKGLGFECKLIEQIPSPKYLFEKK